jgi:putative ABC transport system substrate-binding protein
MPSGKPHPRSVWTRTLDRLQRRDFIVAAVASVVARPVPGCAEPAHRIGYLSTLSEAQVARQLQAFRRGLLETGLVEGQTVEIDYRWAEGRYDRLPAMAAEFVSRPVSLILAQAPPAALAAKAATTRIPIVFVVGFDPVAAGLVRSLSNPGGNATGLTLISNALGQKRVEILRDLAPTASLIAMLVNPVSPDTPGEIESVQGAAKSLGLELAIVNASNPDELDAAFRRIVERHPDGLLVGTDPFFLNQRAALIASAARARIPTIYPFRDYAAGGGLLSYGTDIAASYRQAGIYAGRILKGAQPSDLPVMRPTKFELVVNLKTARSLAIDIPAVVHARSDEVIE